MKTSSGDAWTNYLLGHLPKPEADGLAVKEQFDRLESDAVRKVLNQPRWDEARYLIILYACSRIQPYALQAATFDGLRAFKRVILRDAAKEFGLDFEFFHGAIKMLEDRLERAFGYVKSFRDEGGSTFYAMTREGERIAESALDQASRKATAFETMALPATLLQKFREDLQNRAKRKNLDSQIVKDLLAEYEGHEPAVYTPEVKDDTKPRKVKLGTTAITIGRTEENSINFPNDRFISRRHATIEWTDGCHWVKDMHSRNGTWRIEENGSRVRVEREKLRPNAVYMFGTTRLTFVE